MYNPFIFISNDDAKDEKEMRVSRTKFSLTLFNVLFLYLPSFYIFWEPIFLITFSFCSRVWEISAQQSTQRVFALILEGKAHHHHHQHHLHHHHDTVLK